jgi:phage terminase small subunit
MAASARSGGDKSLGQDNTTPDGPPEMPHSVSEAFETKWTSIVSQIDQNALRRIDGHALTMLCTLLVGADELQCQLRDDPTNAAARRFYLQSVDRVIRLSSMFGLSPVDRMRLKIEKKDESDPFKEWLEGGSDE